MGAFDGKVKVALATNAFICVIVHVVAPCICILHANVSPIHPIHSPVKYILYNQMQCPSRDLGWFVYYYFLSLPLSNSIPHLLHLFGSTSHLFIKQPLHPLCLNFVSFEGPLCLLLFTKIPAL